MSITSVAVVGAGRMGEGIAAALAFGRVDVTIVDLRDRGDAALDYHLRTLDAVRRAFEMKVALRLLDEADLPEVLGRVRVLDRHAAEPVMAEVGLVFEAVPEILEVKREAFSWIESVVATDCPIASTTSSFLVDRLAECVDRPERLLNAHWLNPADLMPLVELSASSVTAPAVVDATRDLLTAVGKQPVVCAASPGYIVPRLQALVMNEAARMVEEGVASAEDIDHAVRIGFGSRFAVLGLLEFIDWGGCDILFHASNYLRTELGERYAPAAVVEEHMASQRRGVTDGAGFYTFDPDTVDAYRAQRTADFAAVLGATGNLRHYTAQPTPIEV
ncbi:3-hydroxybutyryl-CoA dehydrogenase [Gordonia phthalatica]|uniref:L-gulonate 3-dehydrogenase n=1 Tax=Gordonia phthalatica TaxID=1136941 RepID=A0A0N9NFI6_9ACTN|nr:3-hydroxybutyryl-CoA dehydrogenase [Gordonia phthalatica]ALG84404.1 3-hydroxybutyryl-CoA dehydrogenase [Gordonia phthalatica]